MVRNIITDLCHHLEIGIDGNLDIGNKRVIVGTPTITLTNNILTISCDTVGASIYYTLDGSTPTSSSTKYTTAVTLNNSCTIKAIAIKGNKSSIVVSQNYIAILTAWKIVGNSEVHGNEIWSCGEPRTDNITLYDSTKELLDGFLPQTGSYPTTNSSYPDAKYYVFNVKAGYVVRTRGFTNGHIRIRLIDNNAVIKDISIQENEYYISTWDAFYGNNGNITFKKNCQVGLMFLNTSSMPIENGSVVALGIQYHILVQPLGGSIADIALNEPLRKNNIAADTIEFPCDIDGKALVTRNIKKIVINPNEIIASEFGAYRLAAISDALSSDENTIRTLNNLYADVSLENRGASNVAPPRVYMQSTGILIRGTEVQQQDGDVSTYKQELTDFYANGGTFDVLYALATPTTELIDAPQIAEADSYSMVISQGAKAVSWSSFTPNPD